MNRNPKHPTGQFLKRHPKHPVIVRAKVAAVVAVLLAVWSSLWVVSAPAVDLAIHPVGSPARAPAAAKPLPGQLPHSRVTYGEGDIRRAWLAGPMDRYRHRILGDILEAAQLVVETADGKRRSVALPEHRVFEDLEARIVDLTGDLKAEILIVESDRRLGASLAVYHLVNGRLELLMVTPFLGTPNRWLNPLGTGDFDGDGRTDIALVATPHIGGILRLYQLRNSRLELFAEYPNVSTHAIGSRELGLGRVIHAEPRDYLLVPDQAHRNLLLLAWTPAGWQVPARLALPGRLATSLVPSGPNRWHTRLDNGTNYEILFIP